MPGPKVSSWGMPGPRSLPGEGRWVCPGVGMSRGGYTRVEVGIPEVGIPGF